MDYGQVVVRNDGLEDASEVPVCATFDGPAGRRQVITSTLALVPAEGRLNAAWDWAPPESGSWKVGVVAGCSDAAGDSSEGNLLGGTSFEVLDNPSPSIHWLITLGGRVPYLIILGLLATGGMAGVVAAAWVRVSGWNR